MEINDQVAAAAAGQTFQHQRVHILEREVRAALPSISTEKCRNFLNHVISYGLAGLMRTDIFV